MTNPLKTASIVACAWMCQAALGVDDLHAAPVIGPNAWQMPVDVANATNNPVEGDWLNLGWQTFIALNWPAQPGGLGGQPNPNLSITSAAATNSPAVWQSYLSKEQVFLRHGASPGSWTQPRYPSPTITTGNQRLPLLGGFSKLAVTQSETVDDTFEEAFVSAPLIDQQTNYVLFEVRLNQSEFTYLARTGYYDAARQVAAFPTNAKPTFFPMPQTGLDLPTNNAALAFAPPWEGGVAKPLPLWAQQGALEVKATWRILVPGRDQFSRFYQQPGYYETPDGRTNGPVTFGLVGFHILRLTPTTGSTWYWATFEQVDNVDGPHPSFNPGGGTNYPPNGFSYRPGPIQPGQPLPANPPVGVSRPTPIRAEITATNLIYSNALARTPWQYYQLIEVQFPDPNGTNTVPVSRNPTNTGDMRNVTMETYGYAINKRNCTDCHGLGFPQMTTAAASLYQTNGDYQIFTFLLGDAQSSDPAVAASARRRLR